MATAQGVFSFGCAGIGNQVAVTPSTSVNGAGVFLDYTVATGTVTNHEIDIVVNKTGLKGFLLLVRGNFVATVTILTNSTGAADDTWVFAIDPNTTNSIGGAVYQPSSPPSSGLADVLTASITKIYITSSGAQTPLVQLRALYGS